MGSVEHISISDLPIWEEAGRRRTLLSITIDLTARCNNACHHCYINLPEDDTCAKNNELCYDQITHIIDQAVNMGTLWVLLSGGEPLLRPDFFDIYKYIKKKGLLVSVFTNASLITKEHVELFKKYPPRDIEITIYGVTSQIHKKVTAKDTFDATMTGINQLIAAHIPVTLKSTITQANHSQVESIAAFCKNNSSQPYRFDAFLQLRLDKNKKRNKQILNQRLTPAQIFEIEQNDTQHHKALKNTCKHINNLDIPNSLFVCQAGMNSCAIGYDGTFRLCSSLSENKCSISLKDLCLYDTWERFVPEILKIKPRSKEYAQNCGQCANHAICPWCPAHAELETDKLDGFVQYYCDIAQKRMSLGSASKLPKLLFSKSPGF